MDREAGYDLFFCAPDTFAAAGHKIIPREHTHIRTLPSWSFTCFCVATHCWLLGLGGRGGSNRHRRRSRRKALTGTTISGEPEAVSACTPVAASCVHAVLGARPLLAALIHIWETWNRKANVYTCVNLFIEAPVFVQVNVFLCLPVWHRWPVQPSGQVHWLGLKQVPPFTQGCAHMAVRDGWMICHLKEYACVLCWHELDKKMDCTLLELC